MLYPQGVEFGDRNSLGVYSQGVFSTKVHIERSSKHLKVFIYLYIHINFCFMLQKYCFFLIRANFSLFIASKSNLDTAPPSSSPSSLFPSVAFLPPLDSLYCADCQSAFPLPPFPPPPSFLLSPFIFLLPPFLLLRPIDLDTAPPSSFVYFRAMLSPAFLRPFTFHFPPFIFARLPSSFHLSFFTFHFPFIFLP